VKRILEERIPAGRQLDGLTTRFISRQAVPGQ
jgi:hypothetical protein